MRRAAGELTHGLHFLGLSEFCLSRAPLGDITRNLGEADELVPALNGVDDHMGPEAAAVLAKPPALSLKPSFPRSGPKPGHWLVCGPIFRRIEYLEMPADDLV